MKAFIKNKIIIVIFAIFLFTISFLYLGLKLISSERNRLELLKEQRTKMVSLCNEYLDKKQRVEISENKKNITNIKSIIQAVDELFQYASLKNKLKSIKTAGLRETKEGIIEEADINIEGINMNELVNILYRIENSPMTLVITRVMIKKSFENPELLNLSITLSFLKPK